MPWSGGSFTRTNGVNTGATLWAQDRDDGTKILATRHDTNDQDMADGINSTLEKSGSNAATGNLNIGSNRLTAVADGTAKTDAATVNQIQSNGPAFQATDTGTANTYVIALSPAITAYAAGQEITFKAGAASTGASTLNVNTLGTKALKKLHDQDIASGDIEAGSIVTAVYDGTNFQVTSQLATEGGTPGGSNTQVQYNSSGSFAGDADFTFDGTNVTVANPLYLPDGSSTAPALSNTGDTNTGIDFPAADTVGVVAGGTEQFRFGSNPIPGGDKNLVQNGSMAVAQRSSQTGLGASTAQTQVDRFKLFCSGTAGRVTADQAAAGGVTSQGSALKVDVTTADASVASGDIMTIRHVIEAQNCQSLRYGDSTAQAVTVSFWMKSPKTGTHCVSLYQSDTGRGYIKEFTIDSANTWEHFKITFPGDTGGAGLNNDTGAGLNIDWPLICGTGEQGSADSWLSSGKIATSNQQNLLDSTSNDVYLTGVQLEIGSVGTDFAHEDLTTTELKCWRYYRRIDAAAGGPAVPACFVRAQNNIKTGVYLVPPMRAVPSLETSGNADDYGINHGGGNVDCNAVPTLSGTGGTDVVGLRFQVGSGPSAGEACIMEYKDGTATGFLAYNAEL